MMYDGVWGRQMAIDGVRGASGGGGPGFGWWMLLGASPSSGGLPIKAFAGSDEQSDKQRSHCANPAYLRLGVKSWDAYGTCVFLYVHALIYGPWVAARIFTAESALHCWLCGYYSLLIFTHCAVRRCLLGGTGVLMKRFWRQRPLALRAWGGAGPQTFYRRRFRPTGGLVMRGRSTSCQSQRFKTRCGWQATGSLRAAAFPRTCPGTTSIAWKTVLRCSSVISSVTPHRG